MPLDLGAPLAIDSGIAVLSPVGTFDAQGELTKATSSSAPDAGVSGVELFFRPIAVSVPGGIRSGRGTAITLVN